MIRSKKTWEKIYQEKSTPWDAGQPKPFIAKIVERGKVKPCLALDIGCGTGNETIYLAKRGFNVTGIDISENAIEIAKEKAKIEGVECEFIALDFLNLKLEKKFDFALDCACFHFLEEQEREKYVEKVSSLLNSGALFLLIVSSDKESFKGPFQFSKQEIQDLFSEAFEIESIKIGVLEKHKERPMPYFCIMKKK